MMGAAYDEYLEENPFFQELQECYKDALENAAKENWIICVPRVGTVQRSNITKDDIFLHILRDDATNKTRYLSLSNKNITKTNNILTLKNEFCYNSVQILFEETFYLENYKYRLWCIECPLTQSFVINDPSDLIHIVNIRDCIHLLCFESNGREVLENINKIADKFIKDFPDLHLVSIDIILAIANSLFDECVDVTLKNSELCSKTKSNALLLEKIRISVETYMQNSLNGHIFNAICANTSQDDAKLNKTIRNLQELQLKNFTINTGFYDTLPLAKFELSKINNYSTVLSKVTCLKQTFTVLSKKETNIVLSANDLLQIFLFLLIKSNVNNWLANLKYLTEFRLSNLNSSDEISFLVCTLEAAIEYIKSGKFEKEHLPKSEHFYMEFELLGCTKNEKTVLQKVFKAIHNKDLDELKKLLQNSKVENVKKVKKCHPLCSCDECEQMNMQERCCTVKSVDDKGRSPLHIACVYGTPDIVEFLIAQGADLNSTDSAGSAPLHYSVLRGHQHALLLLLHAGADINIQDSEGNTPLHSACANGHENCVKGLIYFSENSLSKIDIDKMNRSGNTVLHIACRWGYLPIVSVLLEFGASMSIKNNLGQTPWNVAQSVYVKQELEKAALKQEKEEVERVEKPLDCLKLTSKQASKSKQAKPKNDFEEVYEVKSGHKFGVRPKNIEESKKCTLLLKAIEKNDLPLTRYYLGMRPDFDQSNTAHNSSECHPLCICEKCQACIDTGVDPLPEIEKLNVNMCNVEGYTALHIAAKFGRLEILRLLLDSGALITIETYKTRFSALHIACFYQHLKVVQELLKCGLSDIDIIDSFGNSPLHYAAMAGSDKTVEYLLKHGANANLRNRENRTPLEEAKEKMRLSTAKILKQHQQLEFAQNLQSTYLDKFLVKN